MWALFCQLLCTVGAATLPFVTNWQILAPGDNITLPLKQALSGLVIDWGDGQVTNISTPTLPIYHIYTASGLVNVSILGDLSGFTLSERTVVHMGNLKEIHSWGDSFVVQSATGAFRYSDVVVFATDQPKFLPGASLASFFAESYVNFARPLNWDLTNVVSLERMFAGAAAFNQSINFTNSQGVTSTLSMFASTSSFNSPVMIDTRSVTIMQSMFHGAYQFNQPVNFDTGKVTTMQRMFFNANAFNQPINFNTSSLSNAAEMFACQFSGCTFNSSVNFTDTQLLESVDGMFSGLSAFNQPINFDASNLLSTFEMFRNSVAFNSPVILTNSGKLTMTSAMFEGATSFNQPLSLDTKNVRVMFRMFSGASSFASALNFTSTAKADNMNDMFAGAPGFQQDLRAWETSLTTSCSSFCDHCGLPEFANCDPCNGDPRLWTSSTVTVCKCPSGETCVTVVPTSAPTKAPTTQAPTEAPTDAPTSAPSTATPTRTPSTGAPSFPTTNSPTSAPSTIAPSLAPSTAPAVSAGFKSQCPLFLATVALYLVS